MRTFEHAAPEYSSLQKEDFKLHERDDAIHDAKFETKSVGFFKDAMLRFGKNTASIIAFIIICIIAFFSILGPMMNEYGYNDQDLNRANLPARIPGCEKINLLNGSTVLKNRRKDNLTDTEKYPEGCILEITNESVVNGVKMCDVRIDTYIYSGYGDDYFWFGTDYLGRDLWTRVWRGCRISLIIAFAAVLTNVGFGVIYGSIAGYYGGMVDMVMMRIVDIIYSLPDVLIVILLSVAIKDMISNSKNDLIIRLGPGMISIFIVFGLLYWVGMARQVRGQVLSIKEQEYVLAAQASGASAAHIIRKHMIPNCISVIIITAAMQIPSAIFTESFLSFVGMGVSMPMPSLGSLASDARSGLVSYPYLLLFPAASIFLIVLSFNLLGNGLRDAFDPKLRS